MPLLARSMTHGVAPSPQCGELVESPVTLSDSSAGGSRPLTVALAVTSRLWGGAEQQAALLARGLREGGHSCHIFASRGSPFATRLAAEGFPVATFLGTGRDLVSLWWIRRHLRRLRPDVLHMNDPHALTSAGLASLGLAIPARVAARHSCFPIHYASRYGQLCDRVICVIGAVAEVCRRDGIPAEMLRVVHCGSDDRMLCSGSRQRGRDSLGLSDDQPLLLTVALLNPCKGHAFLLDALPPVIRRHPRLCLALAGDGETAAALQAQARRLRIDAHVRFLGYRHDIADLLRAADLFVMPSLTEGFCSVLIEAMLAGLPMVTTAVGGIPEVVGSDGSTADPIAWTVPAGDSQALSAAILEALASPQNRSQRGLRGRQRALAQFTASRLVERTLGVYRELLPCETAG